MRLTVTFSLFLLTFANALWASQQNDSQLSLVLEEPKIFQNPNPRVPLAAIIRFKTSLPVTTRVKVSDKQDSWNLKFDTSYDPAKGLPILGMRPGRLHKLDIIIKDAAGTVTRRRLQYTTPELKSIGLEFPPISLNKSIPSQMEPGFTLLSVRRSPRERPTLQTKKQIAFRLHWGMLVAIDAQAEVVWYYKLDQRIQGVEQLLNGNLIFNLFDNRSVEIDMLGNTINQWYASRRPQGGQNGAIPIDVDTIHHQPLQMPSGNFLAFSAYGKEIPDYYTSETDPNAPRQTAIVMGDKIIEFTPAGDIVWSWDSFRHLDVFRIGYDTFQPYWDVRGFPRHLDWTHGNGLSYDERDDTVIVSLRHQDAIFKVDRKSGNIKWILGDHSGWSEQLQSRLLKPLNNMRWPYHTHNPRLSHAGTITMFDNGLHQARPFNKPVDPMKAFSRAVEYEVNESDMTVKEIWTSETKKTDDSCYSPAMGDAQRLPRTNNILAIFSLCFNKTDDLTFDERDKTKRHFSEIPLYTRIREYKREQSSPVVFDVDIKDHYDLIQWHAFGGLRLPSLYSDGVLQ